MIVIYLFGAGFAKLAPLLFGFFLSSRLGALPYISFVSLLAFSNFLTAVSTISYTQLILSSGKLGRETTDFHVASGVSMSIITSLLGGLWYCFSSVGNSWVMVMSVIAYSLGNSILTIVIAVHNSKIENKSAGLISLFAYVVAYGAGLMLLLLDVDALICIWILSIIVLAVGMAFYKKLNIKLLALVMSASGVRFGWGNLKITAFVGCVLFSHATILSGVAGANLPEVAAEFSLAYQLFAVGIFIPSALGNVMIPRMANSQKGELFRNSLVLLYLGIAIAWCVIVYIFESLILEVYGFTSSGMHNNIVTTLQFSVVFCSLHALMSQWLASEARYAEMMIASVAYLAFIVCAGSLVGFDARAMAWGFVLSYVFVLIVDILLVKYKWVK